VALPFDDELKAYLRVTTEVEDDLIREINLSAQAWVRAFYKVPLDTQSRTFRTLWPRIGGQREPSTRLIVPIRPCEATAVVTDADGATVDDGTYVVDSRSGYIDSLRGESFGNPPYDVAIGVGWGYHPEYADEIDPILRQAVLWAASTYYRNRNVSAIYEQSGGQVSITYTEEEVPPLLRSLMAGLKDNVWHAL
jgi:hypothetical protein